MILKSYQRFIESKHHGSDYKYGCLLINLDIPNWHEITSFIRPEDVYQPDNPSKGIETDPHVTVLYGLHPEVTDSEVREIINQIDGSKINLKIDGVGVFQNKDFDVVKLNVISDYLHEINSMFKVLPHTSDYSDYKPHITIAYVKPGTGVKYQDDSINYELNKINSIVYSKPNGEKSEYLM